MWSYRCYDDGNAPNLWRRWYDAHPEFQGTHDSTFTILGQQETWRGPQAKNLGDGLIEIKLNGPIQWRIFGFHPGNGQRYAFTVVSNHKQRVYDPPDALKTARKLIKEIKAGKKRTIPCARPE